MISLLFYKDTNFIVQSSGIPLSLVSQIVVSGVKNCLLVTLSWVPAFLSQSVVQDSAVFSFGRNPARRKTKAAEDFSRRLFCLV